MKPALLALIAAGIFLPLLLAAYLICGHGTFEDVFLYSPTLRDLAIVVFLGAASFISSLLDLRKAARKPSVITVGISCLSLLVTIYFAGSVLVPKYIRHGEPAPQLFLSSDMNSKALTFHFAAAGDSHIGARDCRTDRTLKMLKSIGDRRNKYNAFFFLGDAVQLGFSDSMWKEALRDFSVATSKVPVCYVAGNHDTMFGGDELYRTYVLPDKKGPFWRRIDIGRVHFIVLDLEWELQLYSKEQRDWLVKQLISIPKNDWCVVLSHTFYYSSGSREDGWNWYDNTKVIDALKPLFEKYGVDLVLSGHKHDAEVLRKNSVTYMVMGTFGGKLDRERTYRSPASVWYRHDINCFADVTLGKDSGTVLVRDADNRIVFRTRLVNRK